MCYFLRWSNYSDSNLDTTNFYYGIATAGGAGIAVESDTDAITATTSSGARLTRSRRPSAATAIGTCRSKRSLKLEPLKAETGEMSNAQKANMPVVSVEDSAIKMTWILGSSAFK